MMNSLGYTSSQLEGRVTSATIIAQCLGFSGAGKDKAVRDSQVPAKPRREEKFEEENASFVRGYN